VFPPFDFWFIIVKKNL